MERLHHQDGLSATNINTGANSMRNDRNTPDAPALPGRRAILEYSAAAGAAIVAAFGAADVAVEAAAPQTSGKMSVPNGKMRRVVTAHNAEGKSYIRIDETVDAAKLWTTSPDQPLGGALEKEPAGVSHATGETRCFVAAIPPSRDPKPTTSNRVGYHRANGIAYCLILDGELVFLVDTQEVTVRAGDVIVERNTLHSWRNEGTQPVSMFIVTVNASS
jgi:hypothetical protein